jgi:hypothetical protein
VPTLPVQGSSEGHPQRSHPNSGEKPFECPHCPFKAARKSTLNDHIRTHSGEKPFECPHCPFKAAKKSTLSRHIRTHSGEKPFECPHCPFKAAKKANLNDHIRTHTGGKPFECPHCTYKAPRQCTLTKHLKVHTAAGVAAASADAAVAAATEHSSECVFCFDAGPTLVCIPCGHQCICDADLCTASVMDPRECLYCHADVDELLETAEAKVKLAQSGRRIYTV